MNFVSVVILQAYFLMCLRIDLCQAHIDGLDILVPYKLHHGPQIRTNRDVQSCQNVQYGNVTHSKLKVNKSEELVLPLVSSKHTFVSVGNYVFNQRDELLHYAIVNNPLQTLSVLEPVAKGSCEEGSGDIRGTVQKTASQKHCLLAVNAGFFNTETGHCLGNLVSDGRIVQDSGGIQNAHFGITSDGYLYFGYLSEIDIIAQEFVELVGGVIWLVRDGAVYVDESQEIECPDTEETGTIEEFVSVRSARVSVGHDIEGRVIIVQVEGKTNSRGVNLHELADIMLQLGAVNAINLDGGGSATLVINGTLVNYPSDRCKDDDNFRCVRNVSTILCVHEPDCEPPDCSGHGTCVMGSCLCSSNWVGKQCNALECPESCSNHGVCQEGGCRCNSGWQGERCGSPCPAQWYGLDCKFHCACQHNSSCDAVTGQCSCLPGFSGTMCENGCGHGTFGKNCARMCTCEDDCTCNPVTGSCNYTMEDTELSETAHCFANRLINDQHLVPDQSDDLRMSFVGLIGISIFAGCSIILNIILAYLYWKRQRRKEPMYRRPTFRASSRTFVFHSDSEILDTDSSNEIVELKELSPSIMQNGRTVGRFDKTES